MITTWVLLGLVWTSIAVGWYADHKWMRLLREQRKSKDRWRKLAKEGRRVAKLWRDLYKGREVFIPSCWPEDMELPDGRWEFVEVTTTKGDGAPTETMTGEEKP